MQRAERRISAAIGIISISALILWMAGCASVSLRAGRQHLDREEYHQAVEALKRALNEDTENPEIHRDLGIAYYGAKDFSRALEELTLAKQKLSKDSSVIYYLGLTYEALEDYDRAIEEYNNYVRLSRFRRMRRKIQKRSVQLSQRAARLWAKESVESEENIDVASIPDNTIAVTYFRPIQVSKELEPLHIGLTQLLITDLKNVKSLEVVERIRLKEIYSEMDLSSREFVDQDTAPRLGKLLGASNLVTGAFTEFSNETWRIDLALGQTKTGDLRALESLEGDFAEFLETEKDLVFQILMKLNIEPTDLERDNIMRNIPTESAEAFVSYSKGLDYLDREMYSEAKEEFKSAVSMDSGFDQARDSLFEAESLSQPMDSISDLEETREIESSAHEAAHEILIDTVGEVSQRDMGSEPIPRVPDPEPREVLLRIEW